jgi:TRAP-type C4-dicarboxylate transport system permease small subunit
MSSSADKISHENGKGGPVKGFLPRSIEWFSAMTDKIAITLLLTLLGLIFTMTVSRSAFNVAWAWMDDLARYLLIWVVYTSAVSLTMKGQHIVMDALFIHLSPSWKRFIRKLIGLSMLIFSALTGYLALQQAIAVVQRGEVSSTGVIPAIVGYASLPFGFAVMVFASLYYLLYRVRSD